MTPVRPVVLVLFLVLFIPPSLPASTETSVPSPDPLAQATALFESKRIPEARAQLADIVAREPKNIRALHLLGLCEMKMQRREDAVATLAKAAALAPKNHEILADYGGAGMLHAAQMGVSFRAIGYARRGRAALEQASALAPDNVSYREGLVQFYARAPVIAGGSFAKAYAHIDEIAKRDPARAAILRANTLAADERHPEALAACESFLAEHPDHYLALYTLGRIASETGRELERGEKALRRCLQLDPRTEEPDHAMVHYRLGLIAEKARRPADARLAYQAALALEPDFPEAREALEKLRP